MNINLIVLGLCLAVLLLSWRISGIRSDNYKNYKSLKLLASELAKTQLIVENYDKTRERI
jgi:hypothetical protein